MIDLPDGWALTSLGQIAGFEMGQAPPSSASNFNEQGSVFVKAGEFGHVTPIVREWTTQPLKFAGSGDVLICVVGATAGKLNLGIDCAIGRSVAAIQPYPEIHQRLLYQQLKLQVERLRKDSTGSAQGVISKSMLDAVPVRLPPQAEQCRIADKLDSVLARVGAVNDRLARVAPLLKRFRQSVLAAATSGKLTEEWRTSVDKQPPPDSSGLPSTWRYAKFKEVCTEITVGFVGRMSDQYVESGIPFLRSMNVRPFYFDKKGLQYISTAFHQQISKSRLRAGDLAIVRSGAPGVCCVVPDELGEANCSDLVIARPGPLLLAGYGCIFMNSSFGAAHVASNVVGVAQAHFNVGSMKETPFPLPQVDEQAEIVRRVELLFAYADRLEARLQAAQTAAQRLTPSLLAKAFRGELVPQDPNDEPAAELLKRLAASRESQAAKPAKRGRAAAKT